MKGIHRPRRCINLGSIMERLNLALLKAIGKAHNRGNDACRRLEETYTQGAYSRTSCYGTQR